MMQAEASASSAVAPGIVAPVDPSLESARAPDSAREASPPRADAPSRGRARVILAVKILVTIAALAYTFTRVTPRELTGAVMRLSASAVVIAVALTLLNLVVAAVRWRVLFAAYGARDIPGVAFLSRAQLVGFFYNTFVPGAVTGDVLRGHATRACFEGPLGSYMVVGLERFFGLAGVFSLGAIGLLLHPLPGVRADVLAGFAFAASLVIGLVPVLGRKVGGFLPGRVGKWAANLPAVERPSLLIVILVMSLLTHTIVGLTGHVLLASIAPQITMSESVVLVPLAMVSTYMPLSIAGLGVREAAFVFVLAKVGVADHDATAGSLSFFAVCAIVAALGGLTHVLAPLKIAAGPIAEKPRS